MLRFVTVPPKTPTESLQTLRKAFAATFNDRDFKAESNRMLQFQLLTFVGEEAEKVNASVFRAATGPAREMLKKLSQQ
jgi:tripartite-type tricarboxylate transporter receptor subunit TctC